MKQVQTQAWTFIILHPSILAAEHHGQELYSSTASLRLRLRLGGSIRIKDEYVV